MRKIVIVAVCSFVLGVFLCNTLSRDSEEVNYINEIRMYMLLLETLDDNKTDKTRTILTSHILSAFYMIEASDDMDKYTELCQSAIKDKFKIKNIYDVNLSKIKNTNFYYSVKDLQKKAKLGREKIIKYCKQELPQQKQIAKTNK